MPSRFHAYWCHAQYYLQMAHNISKLYLQGNENVLKALAVVDTELPHLIDGQAWSATNWETNQDIARLCNAYPEALADVADLRLSFRQWIEWVEPALDAARHLKDREDEGIHLSYLGNAYAELGEVEQAIQYFEQALVIDREIQSTTNEGADLLHLGSVYTDLVGDMPKGIELLNQALAVAQKVGDKRLEGSVWGQLGNARGYMGEQSQAIDCYQQALNIAQGIGDRRSQASWLGNLATAYRAKGEPNRAIELYEQALKFSKELGDRRNEGKHIGNIGITHYHLD
ncbi:MAG: tetratricopeptide repeat protein, partial [Chloroflexi bacterium]|nr:tetratricopeptide repeat protein [Chloroflexota bacterium]